jgi:hypothetical protein
MTATKDSTNSFDTNGHADSFRAMVGSDISYSGVAALALTASGAILTYTGPTRDALAVLSISYFPSADTTNPTTGIGIAKNGDLIGLAVYGDTETADGVQAANLPVNFAVGSSPSLSVTAQRKVSLASGDTLRPVGAKEIGNTDLTITGLVMTVFLL